MYEYRTVRTGTSTYLGIGGYLLSTVRVLVLGGGGGGDSPQVTPPPGPKVRTWTVLVPYRYCSTLLVRVRYGNPKPLTQPLWLRSCALRSYGSSSLRTNTLV